MDWWCSPLLIVHVAVLAAVLMDAVDGVATADVVAEVSAVCMHGWHLQMLLKYVREHTHYVCVCTHNTLAGGGGICHHNNTTVDGIVTHNITYITFTYLCTCVGSTFESVPLTTGGRGQTSKCVATQLRARVCATYTQQHTSWRVGWMCASFALVLGGSCYVVSLRCPH